VKKVLQEGALLAVVGAVLAFAANALSPHPLELTVDHFPGDRVASPTTAGATNLTKAAATTTNSPAELLAANLRAKGLQLAESNQVMQFFHDPRRLQDGIIFIDARDEDHYRAGHIPGAYHFDRFHPENYLINVIQVCQTAQDIVFYCNGGDCDDSEHAAIMLRDSIGIPKEKVFVYGGGFTEWTNNGLSFELGSRNSGDLTNAAKTAAAGKVEGSKP
jgi:rhodanese-related sulfurtransferase